MKIFGERLKELRTAHGITQKQLATILCVSGNTIHCWECDIQEPSLLTVLKIAQYFDVSTDYLLGKVDY